MNTRKATLSGLALLSVCAQLSASEPTKLPAPIAESSTFDDRPLNGEAHRHAGDVVFNSAGNALTDPDLVAIDLGSGQKRVLARAIGDARFLARDERFIVVARRAQTGTELSLVSPSNGETHSRASLEGAIERAAIMGDRIFVVQQERRQGRATLLAMELPTLKRLKAVAVSRIADTAVWRDNLLLLGRSLEYLDRDLQSRAIVEIPSTPPVPGHSCSDGPLRVEGDRAIAVVACGYIHVFDLEARRHQFVMPRYADSYGIDVAQELIFTTPAYWLTYGNGGRVFDLNNGRELATFPFAGERLFASGEGLAALSTEPSLRPQFTLYRYDAAALRDGGWQLERATAGCAAARELAEGGEFSTAADRCEAAGILSVPREAWRRPPLAPYARQYAHWLSQALDRSAEALAALDAVRGPDRDVELAGWREEARLKRILLDPSANLPVTATPRRGSFSGVFSRGSQALVSVPTPIRLDQLGALLHVDGDRAYVGRWGCGGSDIECTDDKHYVDVLDSSTFSLLRSIQIEGVEGSSDYISSVAATGKIIYVTAAYRYGNEPRPNAFAYDSRTLERRAVGTLPEGSRLLVRKGKLLACACGAEGAQSCLAVHPETLRIREETSWSCLSAGQDYQAEHAAVGTAPVATPNYFVSPLPHHPRDNGFQVSVRDAATPAPPLTRLMTGDMRSFVFPVPGADRVVTLRYHQGRARLGLLDIPAGRFSTLEVLENAYGGIPVVADSRRIYAGRGRDLLVYGQSTRRLEHYIRDFIPRNGNPTAIMRMVIIGHRLVVLTHDGKSSRVLDLRQLGAKSLASLR
jgi:hypothetical protein